MFYDCLGGNKYKVTVILYRDCSQSAGLGSALTIGVFASNNALVKTFNVLRDSAVDVNKIIGNPCLLENPDLCRQVGYFSAEVEISPLIGGFTLVYQRCCGSNSVLNLLNPASTGITIQAHIPDPSLVTCNSNPRFINPPPVQVCANYDINYDYSAFDPDGDSLVYAFSTPYAGGSAFDPIPQPPTKPPYTAIGWDIGYSQNYQVDANPALTINSETGRVNGEPNSPGWYNISVCVKEYRNGILLSKTQRDFIISVENCLSSSGASFDIDYSDCGGVDANFINTSINQNQNYWDFGDLSILSDTSILVNPSYSFGNFGPYDITLITNPGYFCADTITKNLAVIQESNVQLPKLDPQCFPGNNFLLNPNGNFSPGATFQWDFYGEGNPSSLTGQNISIDFDEFGIYPFDLTFEDGSCIQSKKDTLIVHPYPNFDISIDKDTLCKGDEVFFSVTSNSWTEIEYRWEFGDGDFSTDSNAAHQYDQPGEFFPILEIYGNSVCIINESLPLDFVVVFENPTANFDIDKTDFELYPTIINITNLSGYDSTTYFINHLFWTAEDDWSKEFSESGLYLIKQYVVNEFGCKDSTELSFKIIPNNFLFIPNAFSPNGDGMNDEFKPIIGEVLEYEFRVFDRWGLILFETEDPSEVWDGQGVDSGSFIYQVKALFSGNKLVTKEGNFVLIR